MSAIALRSFVSGVCLLAVSSPLYAQVSSGSNRPYRGLFGGGAQANASHSLDLFATLIQAYDDNLLAEAGRIRGAAPVLSGHYTMLLADAAYAWQREGVHFGMTAASAARYYSQLQEIRSIGHSVGLGLSMQLQKRTSLFLNQTAAYSPSYLYGLFPSLVEPAPGAAPPIAPDYSVNDVESYSYRATARLRQGFTRRGAVSATADYRYTDFSGESLRPDARSYGAGLQFSHSMTRNTGFQVGYRYRTGEFGYGDGTTIEHGLDVGVNYTRPLSASRRAVFAISVGSSTTDGSGSGLPAAAVGRRYRLLGDASVGYEFSRIWQARVKYRRGLDYVAELGEPLFTAGFTSSVGADVTRRLNFGASAGYSSGESALYRRASTFDTYMATVRLRWALARVAATYAEYLYYYYDFRGQTQLRLGMPSRLERNGIRVGLTVWVPALRR